MVRFSHIQIRVRNVQFLADRGSSSGFVLVPVVSAPLPVRVKVVAPETIFRIVLCLVGVLCFSSRSCSRSSFS